MNAFVYIFFDPRNGDPKYVGIGGEHRAFRHLQGNGSSNKGLQAFIEEMKSVGISIKPIMIPQESKEQAKKTEIYMIKLYGRVDLGTGTLFNLTDGGDGMLNPSPYIKEIMRGVNSSDAHRKALSESLKGRKFSDDHKEKLSKAARKRQAILTCPHCQKQGNECGMKTWHFDNCRTVKDSQ